MGHSSRDNSHRKGCFYRFGYNKPGLKAIKIDVGHFFYEYKPDLVLADESQFFVGSEIHILSDTEVQGYSRVRGGWNKG